jgi:hypothetical protein
MIIPFDKTKAPAQQAQPMPSETMMLLAAAEMRQQQAKKRPKPSAPSVEAES